MDVLRPWLVIHGDQVGGDWASMSRDDMKALWSQGFSLEQINEWLTRRLSEERYCKVGEKFSEIDLM